MNTPTIDFKGLGDWVEIFRAGRRTDSSGHTQAFSHADLDEMIATHDPEHPAPHVITHQELYSPFRYGEAAEYRRVGDSLQVKSANLAPEFEALVANRRLPDRSIRLHKTADGWKIGHIAWLGVEPPAVEGMAPVEYAAPDGDTYDYVSADWRATNALARMMRNMREFLIDKFSVEDADRVLPDWHIENVEEINLERKRESGAAGTGSPEFAKHPPSQTQPTGGDPVTQYSQDQLDAAVQTAVAAAASDFQAKTDQMSQELATAQRAGRIAAHIATVNELIDGGKLIPAQATGMAEFMAQLDATEATFEYSAADDKQPETKTPAQWFADFVANLAQVSTLGETDFSDDDSSSTDFSLPVGATVDPDKLIIHQRALEYQRKNPGVDYTTAVIAVSD